MDSGCLHLGDDLFYVDCLKLALRNFQTYRLVTALNAQCKPADAGLSYLRQLFRVGHGVYS